MATEEQLKAALEQAAATIEEQQALIQQLVAPPLSIGVIKNDTQKDEGVYILTDKGTMICEPVPGKVFKTGDVVSLNGGGQIVGKLEKQLKTGGISIARDVKEDRVEVETAGSVVWALTPSDMKVEKGDRLLLDTTNTVVMENLGKDQSRFKLAKKTGISWEDIGGQEDAKKAFIEAIELPLMYPEIYDFYGRRRSKGILLYGPPGNGKTLIGKAAATAIAKASGDEDANAFMYIKGPEILSKWVGESEATIRSIFARARDYQKEHDHPCVLFIDEADALLGKRGSGISSDMEKTIVPMFLSEMDGLDESGTFVILATNRPDTLDAAVTREGRIDKKISVKRPDQKVAHQIFVVHLKNIPLTEGEDKEALAVHGATELFSDRHALYDIEMKSGEKKKFTLGHICSGAMIASICNHSTTVALNKDIKEERKPTGVSREDLTEAVEYVAFQNRELDFKEDVKNYVEPFKSAVKRVARSVPVFS